MPLRIPVGVQTSPVKMGSTETGRARSKWLVAIIYLRRVKPLPMSAIVRPRNNVLVLESLSTDQESAKFIAVQRRAHAPKIALDNVAYYCFAYTRAIHF